MLSSRAIVRSGPSIGLRTPLQGSRVLPASSLSHRLGHGRQFSSLRSSQLSGLTTSSPFRARNVTGSVLLGSVASSRQFSLFGYGKKTTPEENTLSTSAPSSEAASTPEAIRPVDLTPVPDDIQPPPPAESFASSSMPEADLSSISNLSNEQSLLNMPEQIGYLKALGLDYGWGPTSVMQWTLEHIHIYTGLTWGLSMAATAVLLRVVFFYPQIRAMHFSAKMQEMRRDPRSAEATKLITEGVRTRDMDKRQRGQYINSLLKNEYDISSWGILWSLGQIPFTYGLFRIVTGMTHIPVPALENAGFLWFPDLTVADPYFVLPALSTVFMITTLSISSKSVPPAQQKVLNLMKYVFGGFGLLIASFFSAAINLMAVSVGFTAVITTYLLNHPAIRRTLGLPSLSVFAPTTKGPTYQSPRSSRSTPDMNLNVNKSDKGSIRERLTDNIDDMKKGASSWMTSMTGRVAMTKSEQAEQKRKEIARKLESTRQEQEREEFERRFKK
ncbi:hypothetical protein E4U17_002793 [Claviceps sp. LM77 group G4]|nr:hypothetical protein E4U17_002793 [Claviceps sp. LM77 group G4]KAG6073815.1 hypothetical protein E4U33_002721 [Claviceps sp. LM78 group G4]KAG6076087.1 hypothetical protein E4U16_002984 [Claviceps sp. LM84 group G4]